MIPETLPANDLKSLRSGLGSRRSVMGFVGRRVPTTAVVHVLRWAVSTLRCQEGCEVRSLNA
jgi:hypothetical protein